MKQRHIKLLNEADRIEQARPDLAEDMRVLVYLEKLERYEKLKRLVELIDEIQANAPAPGSADKTAARTAWIMKQSH